MPSLRGQLPRHIVRQFQSPYTPSPRGLSRISARQVALALASRFSRMLSFQIKDMEFTGGSLGQWRNIARNHGNIDIILIHERPSVSLLPSNNPQGKRAQELARAI